MAAFSKNDKNRFFRGLTPGQLPSRGIPKEEVLGLGKLIESQSSSDSDADVAFELPIDSTLFDTASSLEVPSAPPLEATSAVAESEMPIAVESETVPFDLVDPPSPESLSIQEQIEPESVGVSSEDMAECAMPPVDPQRKRPADVHLAAIFDVRERLALQNPFEVLGLTPGAPLSAIRDACSRLMAKYQTSKYHDVMMTDESLQDLADIREHVAFCAKTLCDPTRRGVVERLAGGDFDAVRLRRYFAADQLFRDGVNRLRAKSYVEAKQFIQMAINDDPNDPDYHTRLAQTMIEIYRSSGTFNEAAQVIVAGHLTTALELDPRYEPAALLLGRVLIAKRDFRGALTCYQRILVTNPRNQEARRAVRKLSEKVEMEQPVKEESALSSLFDRLRKER